MAAEVAAAQKLQAVWRGYQVRKSLWEEYYEQQEPCACGEPATVCGECADCFWDNYEADKRRRCEERMGLSEPRFPCGGCAKLFKERQMLALDGESYCEACFQEAINDWEEPEPAKSAEADAAEAKANTYMKKPLHCCGDPHCEGDCDQHYCGCQGKCRCDDEDIAEWHAEEWADY